MSNRRRGEVKADIGGKERILKLTLNDLAELQERYDDLPLIDILSKLDKMDVKLLRVLLYLSIRHEDSDLTEKQVGAFDINITDAATAIGECIAASLGGDNKKGKK